MKVYSCITTVGQFTIKPDEPNFIHHFNEGLFGPLLPVTMGRIRELSDGTKLFEPQSEGSNIYINLMSIVAVTEVDVVDEPMTIDQPITEDSPIVLSS